MEDLVRKLREYEFSREIRGYKMDEVDEILESAADEIERLTKEIAQLKRQGPSGVPVVDKPPEIKIADESSLTEAMSKTLLLAQKTADSVLADAKEQAAKMVTQAEAEAKKISYEAKARLASDLENLEKTRSQLAKEVDELNKLLSKERDELVDSLVKLADWIKGHLSSDRLKAVIDKPDAASGNLGNSGVQKAVTDTGTMPALGDQSSFSQASLKFN
jgi:cell division initiation protein